ncbi:GntR family transcriptional regulator [Paenibacillus sp. alder61]|uniref:GntR family transcriptional regulator n=1 Tax=Paenibacillus sp. alder61 TaxID=2862948 RepID=UPI001CD676DD|nr:GntR family transcriptional regulator [Paenibacillus sp. alder61]MCA1294797.1 GntR family transcriptional regulator [Paenibacillus sp. alder61]
MVKEQITEWIRDGKVKPGDKIYSEKELSGMFGVSRHTVRQAIGALVHEGLLYREQGAGTFCSASPNLSVNESHAGASLGPGLSAGLSAGVGAGPSGFSPANVNRKNIGVITTYISDYIFPSIIKGIESYLTAEGYSLTLACTDNDVEKEKQCLQAMLDRGIDGLIVEPTRSSNYNPNINYYLTLEQKQIPYLMINQFYSQLMPPHLIVNDDLGGFMATDHLIRLGHERIVGLFKTDDLQGVNRMKGFIRAFRENQVTFFPEMVLTYTTEEQSSAVIRRLEPFFNGTSPLPTAIVCYNDQLALAVLDLLRRQGLRVPDEVSIVGFDDSPLAEASEVKLTSVTHPKMEMGTDAAKWIVAAVEGREQPPQSVVYEPRLVIRSSTAPVKGSEREG